MEQAGLLLLRAEHEEQLATAVGCAVERAGVLNASVGGLREAQRATDTSAALANLQLAAFFDQVAQHRHALGGMVRAVRKAANQPITDHFVARRLFFKVAALCASSESSSNNNNTARGVARDHTQRLAVLAATTPQGPKPGTVVVFVQAPRQQGWRANCRVHAVHGGAWEAREVPPSAFASLLEPRSWHAASVSRSGEVFVAGGMEEDESYQSSCERAVVSREGPWRWKPTVAAMPTPRYLCSACMVGDLFVVVGGANSQGSLDVAEAFHTVRNTWCTLPRLPHRVRGCGVVCVGNKVVVVVGGEDHMERDTATVRALDLAGFVNGQGLGPQWQDLPSLALPRGFAAVAAGDGRVFACGGADKHGESCESLEVDVASSSSLVASDSWTPLPDMPAPRSLAGCCYGGGNVFVVGGFFGGTMATLVRTVFVLNTRTATWAQLESLSTNRGACGAVCVGKRLLVIGGHSRQRLPTCECFDF